jgi:hypothetical protein
VTEASIGPDTQTSSRGQPTSSRCTRICDDGSFHRARYPDIAPRSADIQPMYADLRRRKLPSGQIPRHHPEVSRHPADVRGSAMTEASKGGQSTRCLDRTDALQYASASWRPRLRQSPSRRSSVVEQLIRNQQVIGSNPIVGSTSKSSRIRSLARLRPLARESRPRRRVTPT